MNEPKPIVPSKKTLGAERAQDLLYLVAMEGLHIGRRNGVIHSVIYHTPLPGEFSHLELPYQVTIVFSEKE